MAMQARLGITEQDLSEAFDRSGLAEHGWTLEKALEISAIRVSLSCLASSSKRPRAAQRPYQQGLF